jgi:hypothetical protein
MIEETLNRLPRTDALEVAYFAMRVLRYRHILPVTTREFLLRKGAAPPPERIGASVKMLLEEIERAENKRIEDLDDEAAYRYAETLAQLTQQRTSDELNCKPEEVRELLNNLRHTYQTQITPLGVVAIREGQREVNAPEHDTWGTVSCDVCGAKFFVGPHRIYGFRGLKEDFFRQLEEILLEDHRMNRQHQNAYELGG